MSRHKPYFFDYCFRIGESKNMKLRMTAVLLAVTLFLGPAHSQEVGYVEQFALANDRSAALAELIPGTDEYYYYHCLQAQNTQRFGAVEPLVKSWITRHGQTARVQEILYRQALLTYAENPEKTVQFLRSKLGLTFNHQPRRAGQSPRLPTALEAERISAQKFFDVAIRDKKTLNGFRDSILLQLVTYDDLTVEQQHALLSRLVRPDYAGLVALLKKDKKSFGSYPVHRQLLRAHLDELAKAKPALRNNAAFIQAYLANLQVGPEEDWQYDLANREKQLQKLWRFVRSLSVSQNSLKAHVLYHLLVTKERRGVYDKELFVTYLRLPRRSPLVPVEYLKRIGNTQSHAALDADFRGSTALDRIGNDTSLIHSYLAHFFVEAVKHDEFSEFLKEDYLKRTFAETKILNGLGDVERWSSWLPPSAFKELRERVDIEFSPTSRRRFGRNEAVSLDVAIKNVDKLIVKIYEINALNFYLSEGRELNTDLELDGLTANWQRTFEYQDPPFRRVTRHFEFPQLDGPGVYVVDLIGNGLSSRALIRKGQLIAVSRPTAAGQAITVFDENQELVPDAKVYLGGRQFSAGERGHTLVPYTTSAGTKSVILTAGGVASLHQLAHLSEQYDLSAGFYVDRESLLRREKAKVLIRPLLTVNGARVSVKALEDIRLEISTVDLQGIHSTKTIDKFELLDDNDSVYEFRTAAHLSEITFVLSAKVRQISTAQEQQLIASASFSLNGIRSGKNTMNVHLTRSEGLYAIDLMGLTGEPLGDLPIQLTIHHHDYTRPIQVSLKTSEVGRTVLGQLVGIEKIQVRLPDSSIRQWVLRDASFRYPATLHSQRGKPIDLPYLGLEEQASRKEFSLLEVRGTRIVADHFDKLKVIGGRIEIRGLPVGDHRLNLSAENRQIIIRITAGSESQRYLVNAQRVLDADRGPPMFVISAEVGDDEIKIQLANRSDTTRLHIFATRYLANESPFDRLNATPFRELGWVRPARQITQYIEGRDIGEELRYIIDRQYVEKFPGNLLDPPSLLINAWAVRSTQTGTQVAADGADFGTSDPASPPESKKSSSDKRIADGRSASVYLDYLPKTATVILDVPIDEQGMATVSRDLLLGKHLVHLVAIDHQWTDYRRLDLQESAWAPLDLRLHDSFNPDQHLAQQRRVHALRPGDTLTLNETSTSRLQVFDRLSDVYTLYHTFLPQSHLKDFGHLAQWHTLSPEQKRSLYTKYASHELHLFIAQRDREFFQAAVLPLIASKKEPQFMDHYLLGDDLAAYLEPWQYQRLNILERALLARRHPNQVTATVQHLEDLLRRTPLPRVEANRLIETVLGMEGVRWTKTAQVDNNALFRGYMGGKSARIELELASSEEGKRAAGRFGGERIDLIADGRVLKETELQRKGLKTRGRLNLDLEERTNGYADKQMFRQADKTMEWAESQYYRIENVRQGTGLVAVSRFWRDMVQHRGEGAFLSTHFPEAARTFTEAVAALALLDLPLDGDQLEPEFVDGNIVFRNATPAFVVYEESAEADVSNDIPILTSQRFFIDTPEYQQRNAKHDHKYVSGEFLTGTVYGCQIVVTNPTATNRELDILIQVPEGAIAIADSRATRTIPVDVPAFQTKIVQYSFYFPVTGQFAHYPVNIAYEEQIVAFADASRFDVVEEPSKFDTESWAYVSQRGSNDDVLEFLQKRPLDDVQLSDVLYRLKDQSFYADLLQVLQNRRIYDHAVWSYSVHHRDESQMGTFLLHDNNLVSRCGPILDSPILKLNPITRGDYQQFEYRPLINARTHQLGKTRQILNDRMYGQYHQLLNILAHQNTISDTDRLAVVYYLAAQGRTGEALEHFGRVSVDRVDTKIQYDYIAAYLDFFAEDPQRAREIVQQYAEFPVEHWQQAFAAIGVQLDELEGDAPSVVDGDDRNQNQTVLASTEPILTLKNQGNQVTLVSSNIDNLTLNFYAMDIEVLFSRNPFVQQYSNKFSFVRPNASQQLEIGDDKELTISIPEELQRKNVLIEAKGGGKSSITTVLANRLDVNVSDNFGQLKVTAQDSGRPLHTVYVKVYARSANGSVRFYKDGYTDLRGRFDYASLSTNQLDQTQRFSILVLSEQHGAVIREVTPPAR
jgi:hypothetical protein